MTHQLLTIDKWYWGMTTDPNIWQVGSFYDWWWVEIRKDSKKVKLSNSYYNWWTVNTRWYDWRIIWWIVYDNTNNAFFSNDWYMYNFIYWNQREYKLISNNIYNIWQYNNQLKWFLLASNWVYKRDLNNDTYTWIIWNDIVWWLSWFSLWSWWTYSTNLIHTTWTSLASKTLTTVANTRYNVRINYSNTTWSCDITFWTWIIWTLTSSSQNVNFTSVVNTTSTDLILSPTTNFNWTIYSIIIEPINIPQTPNVSVNLNSQSPYLIIWNQILIWNWYVITAIDITTSSWSASTILTIDKDYTIMWITKIWDQIFVYATNWSNTKQYLWDWINTVATRSITWYDKPLQRVISWNNIDYLVVRNNLRASLWVVNWYQPQLICQSDYLYNNSNWKFNFNCSNINSIETIWNKFLLWWYWEIYTYGNYSPWLPQWILREYLYDGYETTMLYYDEWISAYNLYIWTNKWNNNYLQSLYLIDNINTTTLYDTSKTWYVITNWIYGTKYSQDKQTIKVKLWYNLTNTTQTINLYYKIDNDANFTLFKTINNNDTKAILLQKKFKKIMFKIELWTGSIYYSPEIYDFNIIIDDITNDLT